MLNLKQTFSTVSLHYSLQDINPNPPTPGPTDAALTGVSYIGTLLSIVCLTITIITYLAQQ